MPGRIYLHNLRVKGTFQLGATPVTATAAELNIMDGVTATAAEINLIDGSVAGTAVASKALALGANKNVDVLAIADSGLKLGAGAGTAVDATAAELNAAADQTVQGADGFHPIQVAVATFDAAVVGNRTVAPHGLGVTLPAQAIVVGGFFDVNTVFTSDNANNGTIAISVEGANDIQTASAVSGAPYSTIGRKAIVPKANTPESTSVKATVAREITATVAVSALLTGKLTVYLYFICGKASA